MCNTPIYQTNYEPATEPASALSCPQCRRAVHFSGPGHVGQKCACGYFLKVTWAGEVPTLANPITAIVPLAPKPAPAGAWTVVDDKPRLAEPVGPAWVIPAPSAESSFRDALIRYAISVELLKAAMRGQL